MDKYYMQLALEEATRAQDIGEVPIGAVIIYQDEVIATGYNMRETTQKTLSHAELVAIERANQRLNSWRLEDCTLYVTVEPCPMCAGAIIQSRIKRVVFGAPDPKAGCAGTIINLLQMDLFNHQTEVTSGILMSESQTIIKQFFKNIRKRK